MVICGLSVISYQLSVISYSGVESVGIMIMVETRWDESVIDIDSCQ